MENNSRVIYYSINDLPGYYYMLCRSITSLRSFNQSLTVLVYHYGPVKKEQLEFFDRHNVKVFEQEKQPGNAGTFLKWNPLPDIDADHVLFVDADTIFFADAEYLFNRYTAKDFYAREEIKTRPDCPAQMLGGIIIDSSNINHKQFRRLQSSLHSRQMPIFNTGVMLFNRRSHLKIAEQIHWFEILSRNFTNGELAYPSRNTHIAEEITACLILGKVPDLSYGFITYIDSPWYIEWVSRLIEKPGLVMHVWTAYYPFYLLEFEGKEVMFSSPWNPCHYQLDYRPR